MPELMPMLWDNEILDYFYPVHENKYNSSFSFFIVTHPNMLFLKIIFFLSCFIVLYNYAGYAVIVVLFNKLFKNKRAASNAEPGLPSVSFIVAAYNEQDCIREKIENSLQQQYPAHLLEYIFITDGSTDNTPAIVKEYSSVKLLHSDQRAGKSAALNRAVNTAVNDILIFSDANTNLNPEAVHNIAVHYADPLTGGVAGEKKVLKASEN
jgi:cellulose synthase/poly-beta-1,6-N-acetylglucosamine synthase-like glycosyltransferase